MEVLINVVALVVTAEDVKHTNIMMGRMNLVLEVTL